MTTPRSTELFPNVSEMVQESQPDLVHREPIPVKYGYIGMLLTVCFFQLIHIIVTRYGAPKSVKTDFFRWKNTFISWIHALIVGSWDLSCWYLYPEMMSDLIGHYTAWTYSIVVFSTGYFIYDFIDLTRAGRLFSSWEIVLHHWAVISMFFYNVVTCQCIAYNIVALLAEVNSFLLHSRKLLQMLQVDFSSMFYRTVAYLNLVTFIPCRFGACSIIIWGMFSLGHRVSMHYYNTLVVAMVMMSGINVILYYRLVSSDIIRGFSKSKYNKKLYYNANNNVKESHLTEQTNHCNSHSNSIKAKTN